MRKFVVIPIFLASLLATSAMGATWVVRTGGIRDFTTIAAALAAATAGDVVRVGPGTYREAIVITASITLESEFGAAVTILDGRDSHRIMIADGAQATTIRGFTFTHGNADNGSALLVWNAARVTVNDCVFVANLASESNAVHVRHGDSSLTLRDCLFQDNLAAVHSGALSGSMAAHLVVESCRFIGNTGTGSAGAMNVSEAYLELRDCLFMRNAGGYAGALHCWNSTSFVTNNTFHDNSGSLGTVFMYDAGSFTHNIVSGERVGFGFQGVSRVRACNVYHDNASGATAASLAPDELDSDPLYCDAAADIYLLSSGSPAAAGVNSCGRVGACGVGCETRSWGDFKSLFR